MKRRGFLLASLVAALSIAALVGPTLGAQGKGENVYFPSKCDNAKIAPKLVVLGCGDFNFYVNKLDWHGWNRPHPHAKGQAHVNNCKPDCASGTFHKFRGNLELHKIAKCPQDGRKHYKRALFTFPSRRPDGYPQHIFQKFPCSLLH